jgi:hypothetical protein
MRTTAVIATLLLVLASVGCGGGASPNASASGGSSAAPSGGVPTDGVPAAFWIDPASLPVDPTATSLKGFIRETGCASGQSPDGRWYYETGYGSREITITVLVSPLPDPQDCPGNPDHAVTLTFSEPIGERPILDGSTTPPRDATTPPS